MSTRHEGGEERIPEAEQKTPAALVDAHRSEHRLDLVERRCGLDDTRLVGDARQQRER